MVCIGDGAPAQTGGFVLRPRRREEPAKLGDDDLRRNYREQYSSPNFYGVMLQATQIGYQVVKPIVLISETDDFIPDRVFEEAVLLLENGRGERAVMRRTGTGRTLDWKLLVEK